ncbi:phage tail tape measure protein [Bradyrhizobium sp. STM 3557]|uniref:phage tail tape measure protein n=1 Tax=Bradyrhizobium sp. STM 3557 TaxID=578920 RepID=UPI00388F71AE
MATGFSVFVNIGGKVSPSLNAAVNAAKSQVNGLAASLAAASKSFSAPFVAVNKHLDATAKRMATVQRAGRNATLGVTAPVGLMAISAIKAANERAKAINVLDAVGLDDYGADQEKERAAARDDIVKFADTLSKKYGDATEILKTFNELLKAGFSAPAAKGSIETVLQGAAGAEDMSGAELGGYVTKLATQFRLGMKSTEDAAASTQRIVDALVYGALKTSASTKDMAQSFKYVGAAAAAAGQSVEKTNALVISLAKGGFVNSESGVALRSAYVRLVKPTKGGRAAMAKLGLNYSDYVSQGNRTGAGISAGLSAQGYDIEPKLIDKALASNKGVPEKQRKAIYDAIVTKLGATKAEDLKTIMEAVDDSFTASGNEIDLIKLLKDLKAKGAGQGELAAIFEGRQSVRMMASMMQNLDDILKDVEGYSKGYTQKVFKRLFVGLPAQITELDASYKMLRNTLTELVMPDVLKGMKWLEQSMIRLREANPALLKTGIYLTAAAAAAGPLMFALGALGRVGLVGLKGLNMVTLGLLVPFRLLGTVLLWVARGLLLLPARAAAAAIGLRMLTALGAGTTLSALAMSLVRLAAAPFLLIASGIRAVALAMVSLVANPVGLIIAGLVVGLTALGVWVSNNWEGIKSFFAGFGEGFMKGLGPAGDSVKQLSDGLASAFKWVSDMLGPLDASNAKWREWGTTVGGIAADGVNTVISAIEKLIGLVGSAIDKFVSLGRAIGNAFKGAWGSGIEGGAPAPAPPVAGARALGGPVSYGKPYLVGERGPELFVPGATGRIETNSMLRRLNASGAAAVASSSSSGGGIVSNSNRVEINMAVNGGDPAEVRRVAEEAVYVALARIESEQRGLLSD